MLKSPYVYFGGKSAIAPRIWELLGNVPNYVEPFGGSMAVTLGRPEWHFAARMPIETVNDSWAFIPNFWRALVADRAAVTRYADWPVFESDLHARHAWLVGQKDSLQARIEGDPEYYDAKIAGWWVWGMACWIGSEFCSGKGPWQVVDGQLVRQETRGQGVTRRLVHLGDAGEGVQRKRVQRKRVHLSGNGNGSGVNAVHMAETTGLAAWMDALSDRFRRVRVVCGDWSRVCGPSVTWTHGLTGVYLDPPYGGETGRDEALYTVEDLRVAHAVRAWCVENGAHPLLRIVLSGYDTEHDALLAHGWRKERWSAKGGFGNQRQDGKNENRHLERVWISPHCLIPTSAQLSLFAEE